MSSRVREILMSSFRGIFGSDSRGIGFRYLINCGAFLLVGLATALALQIEMFSASRQFLDSQMFGEVLTQHGMLMVFVFLLPLFPGTLGNLVLPAALGVKNLAMPRLNLVGWLCHLIGGVLIVVSIELGAYTSGWTMLMPAGVPASTYVALLVGLALCAGSVLGLAICILRTILSRKHRAIAVKQLPLIAWFFCFWALVQILVTPIRVATLVLAILAANKNGAALSLVDADGIVRYQQLFWLYTGPAILATLLPAIGITFEVLSAHARKHLVSRTKYVIVGIGLALLILVSGSQHLITVPEQEKLAAIGSLFASLTVVPLFLIVISWLGMVLQARGIRSVPLTFIRLQIVLMALSLPGTLALAIPALGVYLHNSYFAVAHLHLLILGTVTTSFLAGLFHWLTLLTGREYSQRLARLVAGGLLVGIVVTFAPLFLLGSKGSPKNLHVYPEQFQTLHQISTAGAVVLCGSLVLGVAVAVWGSLRGFRSSINQDLYSTGGEFSYAQISIGSQETMLRD